MAERKEGQRAFRDDFVWGAAAASYQIEGAHDEDGKGLSVWDLLCLKDKAIHGGHTGETACDHYHRYQEDVDLMGALGLKGYRLSFSWPRILPEGRGRLNAKGVDFYDRLLDALLKKGVEPFATAFHWDYPYELYLRGGWLNPDSPAWFAEYCTVLAEKFSDRVKRWMTLNEPACTVELGHRAGIQAPGLKLDWPDALRVTRNCLLAHGLGVKALRAAAKGPIEVGFAPVGRYYFPALDQDGKASPANIEAARQKTFATEGQTTWPLCWWTEPVFGGRYPEDAEKIFAKNLPPFKPEDLAVISEPVDFCGFNLYGGSAVKAGEDGKPEAVPFEPGHPVTVFGWAVTPEALYWASRFLYDRYKKPLYITENGLASMDWICRDGRVHDSMRIDFTERYLRGVAQAAKDGVDVRGYFHWSILDNFEWAEGYSKRFGLIHVDYRTQKRTPKDSYYWYRDLIAEKGARLFA